MSTTTEAVEPSKLAQVYMFEGVKYPHQRRAALWLLPEPNYSPISDDYSAGIDPHDMFHAWASTVRSEGGFHEAMGEPWVGIYWSVQGEGVIETAPFQRFGLSDFLTHFTWPVDANGKRLNWLSLPVRMGAKTRFIEQAIGWVPAALQPVVNLELLESAYWEAER